MRFSEEDFDEAFAFTDGEGFTAGHEGEFADFEFEAFLLRGAFGQADAGYLRFAVGATGEDVHFAWRFTGEHAFDRLDGLKAGHVGEPGGSDDVAGGVDAAQGGFVFVVRLDPAFGVEFDLESFGHEWGHTDGDEGDGGFEGFADFATHCQFDAFVGCLGFVDFGPCEEADALFGQGFFQGHGNIRVLDRQNVGQHFNHGHFRAEGVEEVGEFDADGAGADDDDLFRLFRQDHGLLAADHAFAVEGEAGHFARDDAGGDENFRRGVRGFLAVRIGDFNHPGFGDGGGAAEVIDLVLFEEHLDTAGQFVDYTAAAADHFGPVEGKFFEGHAEFGGMLGHHLVKFCVADKRFGRDATPVEASAADAFHFDAGHFFPELRGADCADISGGSAAYHDEVVCHKNV